MKEISKTFDHELIKETLQKNVCRVTFTKVNGEERVMRCTLNEMMIPKIESSESKKLKKENPEVQAVYDMDANGWRSFRWDSIKEFGLYT